MMLHLIVWLIANIRFETAAPENVTFDDNDLAFGCGRVWKRYWEREGERWVSELGDEYVESYSWYPATLNGMPLDLSDRKGFVAGVLPHLTTEMLLK